MFPGVGDGEETMLLDDIEDCADGLCLLQWRSRLYQFHLQLPLLRHRQTIVNIIIILSPLPRARAEKGRRKGGRKYFSRCGSFWKLLGREKERSGNGVIN